MTFLFDEDQQVAIDTATTRRVTLPLHRQLHAFAHTRGDMECDHLFSTHDALAITLGTFACDRLARSAARGAGGLRLHLAEDGVGHARHVTATMAGRTLLDGLLVLCPTAVTVRAGHVFLDLDLLLHARSDLLEREFHLHTQIGATLHDTSATASVAEAAKSSEPGEMSAEEVAELREDVLHRHTAAESTRTAAGCTAHSGMSETVITGAFLVVAQHVVSLSGFFELLLRLLIARVTIRVILDGLLPVSLLYLVC